MQFNQLNSAIANAVSGVGNSIHVPVQDLPGCKTLQEERTK
jgi:hypothetical protein